MSRKTKPSQVHKAPVKTHHKMSRVGDLMIPGSVKPGQVIIGFSEFLHQWLVYRISGSLQVIPSVHTFTSQEEAQTYGNQYIYVGNRWIFSPAIPVQSKHGSEDFDYYLPEDGGSMA